MNKRLAERIPLTRPVKMHFFGEQVDLSTSEDISSSGFFVRTDSVRDLQKGVVAVVSIEFGVDETAQYLAEIVRVTLDGVGFQIIETIATSDHKAPPQIQA